MVPLFQDKAKTRRRMIDRATPCIAHARFRQIPGELLLELSHIVQQARKICHMLHFDWFEGFGGALCGATAMLLR